MTKETHTITHDKSYKKEKIDNIDIPYVNLGKETSYLPGKQIHYQTVFALDAKIASNGPSDGDWGHGGRFYLKAGAGRSGMDGYLRLNKTSFDENDQLITHYKEIDLNNIDSIELLVGGECEVRVLRDLFKEVYELLNEKVIVHDYKVEKYNGVL